MSEVAPKQRVADRYVLEEHVGEGGMAQIWRAQDDVLARTVALKVLRSDLASRDDFRERFRREAVAAARLNHPSIVRIFDTGIDDGVAFIVMEYFEGRSLAEVMAERGPMDASSAISLTLPLLDALGYAHGAGVVHRDVSPANILVAPGGRVKVADFGLAKAVAGEDLTTTGKVLGTVRYLSPEQVRGDEVDPRSDLYSVGVVLYELVSGRPPFHGETDIATAMMRLTADPVPPGSIVPGLPRAVEAAILRALARAPEDRFSSAEAMRAALERWAPSTGDEGSPVAAPAPYVEAPARGSGSTFRSWLLVPLLLVLVAIGAVTAGLALGRLELGGPLLIRGAGPGQGGRLVTVPIVRAQDFDPFGNPDTENPEEAPLAIDGQDGTVWSTNHYNSSAFGALKPGLGLFLDLEGSARVSRVVVTSPVPGWRFQLLPGPGPDENARPIRSADGDTTFTMPDSGRLVIELAPVRIPGLMIWITELAPDPQGDRFVAEIDDVALSGPRR